MEFSQLTDKQVERVYRRAYRFMVEMVGCSLVDWRTLHYLSPTWYNTLKAIRLEMVARKIA